MPTLSRRPFLFAGASMAAAGLLAKTAAAQSDLPSALTVQMSEPQFTTWASLLQQSGLAAYADSVSFTGFIPTNQAFNKYPNFSRDLLPQSAQSFPDTERLTRYIRSHVISGLYPMSSFEGKTVTLKSMSGFPLTVDGSNPQALKVSWRSMAGETATGQAQRPILCRSAILYPVDSVILHY